MLLKEINLNREVFDTNILAESVNCISASTVNKD